MTRQASSEIRQAATNAIVDGVEAFGPIAVGVVLLTTATTGAVGLTALVMLLIGDSAWAAAVAGLTGASGATAAWKHLRPSRDGRRRGEPTMRSF